MKLGTEEKLKGDEYYLGFILFNTTIFLIYKNYWRFGVVKRTPWQWRFALGPFRLDVIK